MPLLDSAGTELRAELRQAWAAFDRLEQASLPSASEAQVAAMRQVFGLVLDLEIRLRRITARGEASRARRSRTLLPFLRRLHAEAEGRFARRALGAWRAEAAREAHDRLAPAKHTRPMEAAERTVCVLSDRSGRCRLRTALVVWRLWARGARRSARIGELCCRAIAAEAQPALGAAFGRWHRCTTVAARQTCARRSESELEVLEEELREQQESCVRLRRQLDDLAHRHDVLGGQCMEVCRQMDTWCGLPADASSPMGSGTSCGSLPRSIAVPHEHIAALRQERTALAAQHREAARQADALRDRVARAADSAEELQLRGRRRAESLSPWSRASAAIDSSERDDVAQELAAATQAYRDMDAELRQLDERAGRLHRSVAELDAEIDAMSPRPEDLLPEAVRKVALRFETSLSVERQQAQVLWQQLEQARRETQKLCTQHDDERERWQAGLRAWQLEKETEADMARQRMASLEQQLGDAKAWADHLKEMNDSRIVGTQLLHGQDVQLDKIKKAVGDLTGIGSIFFGLEGACAQPQDFGRSDAKEDAALEARVAVSSPTCPLAPPTLAGAAGAHASSGPGVVWEGSPLPSRRGVGYVLGPVRKAHCGVADGCSAAGAVHNAPEQPGTPEPTFGAQEPLGVQPAIAVGERLRLGEIAPHQHPGQPPMPHGVRYVVGPARQASQPPSLAAVSRQTSSSALATPLSATAPPRPQSPPTFRGHDIAIEAAVGSGAEAEADCVALPQRLRRIVCA